MMGEYTMKLTEESMTVWKFITWYKIFFINTYKHLARKMCVNLILRGSGKSYLANVKIVFM